MHPIISVSNLTKKYASGLEALKSVDLDIKRGEIFALLGPNGAGKTTLIGIICGTVNASSGTVTVDGHDNVQDYRAARAIIGLVPQELPPTPSKPSGIPSPSAAGCSGCRQAQRTSTRC